MECVRTCVGCRQRDSSRSLLRVAVESGRAVPDPRRRLSGRGVWVHPAERCVRSAVRSSAFARALRQERGLDVSSIEAFVDEENRLNGYGITMSGSK